MNEKEHGHIYERIDELRSQIIAHEKQNREAHQIIMSRIWWIMGLLVSLLLVIIAMLEKSH